MRGPAASSATPPPATQMIKRVNAARVLSATVMVAFTRKHENNNFDIYTIRPDGSDLRQLTTTPANDAHAVWTADSKYLLWNSGIHGLKDEAALYDTTFQPYGGIFMMKADGSEKRQLTDSPWEDGMPRFVPRATGP